MKYFIIVLKWLAWISAAVGIFMCFAGVLTGILIHKPVVIVPAVQRFVDFWIIADSFFLFTIIVFLYVNRYENKKVSN